MLRGEVFILLLIGYVCSVVGFTLLYGPIALFISGIALAAFALFVNVKE